MADISDVTEALGMLVTAALYPNPGLPSVLSVAGVPVLVQGGWPNPNDLVALVNAANAKPPTLSAIVTVYPRPSERNVTRYPRSWQQSGPLQATTVTFTVSGNSITVGSSQMPITAGQNLAVFVNKTPYLYQVAGGDTVQSIAQNMAALIAVDVPGTVASGPVISVPPPAIIGDTRVGSQAPTQLEAKRQEREYQVIIWAPSPALRDQVASPVDTKIGMMPWLSLKDGSKGRLIYKGSPFTDFDQKQGLYRRDLLVTVEYATMATGTAPEAIAIKTVFSQEAPDGSTITPPIRTTYS